MSGPRRRWAASSLKAPRSPWKATLSRSGSIGALYIRRSVLPRRPHLVPDVADGLDHVAARPQLGAEPAYVDVHGPRVPGVAVAPPPGQQLLAGEDAAGSGGEELEQLELLPGQLEGAAPVADLDGHRIDHQVAELDPARRPERGQAPVELADPGVELRPHDGREDEVVDPQLGVQGRQARDLDAEEDGDVGQGRDLAHAL